MGWKKFLIFCIIIIFSTSCIPFKNFYYDENGITKPKNPNFDLAKSPYPYQLKKEDLIDTNSVYIHKYIVKLTNGNEKTEENHLRFFKNGRFFLGGIDEYDNSTTNHYNNFKVGWIGYYKINTQSNIEIEFFWVHEIGKYAKKYGYIKNDSIFLFKYPYKDLNFPKPNKNNCEIYTRKKIAGLTGTTSW